MDPHVPQFIKHADPFDPPSSPSLADGTREPSRCIAHRFLECVNDIASLGDSSKLFKSEISNLSRRIKLLAPLFEEMKELKGTIPEQAVRCFRSLDSALQSARELLHTCHTASRIYLLFESEMIAKEFASVTEAFKHALDDACFNYLDISYEVKEQVELVHAQLKRAKAREDTQTRDVYNDLTIFLSQDSNKSITDAALERLAEKLQLTMIADFRKESRALNSLQPDGKKEFSKRYEQMSVLLARLKEVTFKSEPLVDELETEKAVEPDKLGSPVIPEDFLCPISLELMHDPVIVATGQTYERASIQKWIDAGNRTCPKTQQVLEHLILTPNYVLKSLITQWCTIHGIKLPKKVVAGDRRAVEMLLQKLAIGEPNIQREVAKELRALAKQNAENRVCIAEAGAIPLLVGLLSSPDQGTQEHAVTALLNLSIHEGNKRPIITAGAIDPIIEVLKHGNMEARENAAATLFSLSVVDENKVSIGASDAIPALVSLLQDGTLRGKKDAATALFNLSIYRGNKARAVRAMIVPTLMQLLVDPQSEMVDEALAILAILVTHPEGKTAISQASAIPVLVELITKGSPRNKENAAAVLLALCLNDRSQIAIACGFGAYAALFDLSKNGTSRGRRKASSLLDHMNKQNTC